MASLDLAFNPIHTGPEPREGLNFNSRKYDQYSNHRSETNLKSDPCAIDCQANTARRPLKYSTTDFHNLGCNPQSLCSPWVGPPSDGPGIARCAIDVDSHLRNDSKLTQIRYKQQLRCLPVPTIPFLGRGCLDSDMEMSLRGKDTYADKSCLPRESNYEQRVYQHFDHLNYNPNAVNHTVFPYNQGGLPTRHIFLETYRNGENCKQMNFPQSCNSLKKGNFDNRGNKM